MGVPGPQEPERALWVRSRAGVTAEGHSRWALPDGRTDTARALTTPDKAGDRHGLCPAGDGAALGPYSQPTMPVASVPRQGAAAPLERRAGAGQGPGGTRSGQRASFQLDPGTVAGLQGWGGGPEPQGGAPGEGQVGVEKARRPSAAGAGLRLDVAASAAVVSPAWASPQTQAQGQAGGTSQRPHSAPLERSANPRLDPPPGQAGAASPQPGPPSARRSFPPSLGHPAERTFLHP